MINICFIGLGSIGKRHIKNLCMELEQRKEEYAIDAIRHGDSELPDDIKALIRYQYKSLTEANKQYDMIFVTNPTVNHFDTIVDAAQYSKNLFIEKPVFSNYISDISKINLKSDGVYYIACPMRYNPVMKGIRKIVGDKKVISIRAISSSYLPGWRKGVDYRENYSAKKEMGGGVTLDLIHEIDYITWLFGMPKKCVNIHDKYSDLEITSDDLSVFILKYEDKLAEIHLDYFGRETVRTLEIYCNDCKIVGDFINKTLYICDEAGKREHLEIGNDDLYVVEMEHFCDMVLEGKANDNDLVHANELLRVIEQGRVV